MYFFISGSRGSAKVLEAFQVQCSALLEYTGRVFCYINWARAGAVSEIWRKLRGGAPDHLSLLRVLRLTKHLVTLQLPLCLLEKDKLKINLKQLFYLVSV